MQALSLSEKLPVYNLEMHTGRPSNKMRPPFGMRLHALRENAGFSQQQLAAKLGLAQRTYAYWERNPVALRPEQILNLASVLGVSVEQLLGDETTKRRGSGPIGKMQRLFEAASRLPRSQQQKVAAVLEPFILQHVSDQ